MGAKARVGLIICVALLPRALWAQELPFVHYSPESEINPLPSASVREVVQDAQNYLWFVIFSSGVVRYDGHQMELYSSEDGLAGNGVSNAVQDAQGYLWVVSDSGIAVSNKSLEDYGPGERVRFTQKVGSTQLYNQSVSENTLRADTTNGIWFGTFHSIMQYQWADGDTLSETITPARLRSTDERSAVTSLAVRNDGTVWGGLADGSILWIKPQKPINGWKNGAASLGKGCSAIYRLLEAQNGILLAGCLNGAVWRIDEKGGGLDAALLLNANGSQVLGISEERGGALWIARRLGGAWRLLPTVDDVTKSYALKPAGQYNRQSGLPTEWVNKVQQDVEGNLWFSHSAGISKLRNNYEAFEARTGKSVAGEKPALPNSGVGAVTHLGTGSKRVVWVGTDGGIALLKPGGKTHSITSIPGTAVSALWTLCSDTQGRIWFKDESNLGVIAPRGQPLPGGFPPYQPLDLGHGATGKASFIPFSLNRFCAASQISTGAEKVSTMCFSGEGEVSCWVNNKRYDFGTDAGVPNSKIDGFEIGEKGHLWLGTSDRGLFRSKRPLVDMLDASDNAFDVVWDVERGAKSNKIQSITRTGSNFWIGTSEGLSELDGKAMTVVTHFDDKMGLPHKIIASLDRSKLTGNLWIGTNRGLVELDMKARKIIRTLSKRNGLIDNEVWFHRSVHVDEEGTVYFGTPKGLSLYRPHLDHKSTVVPRPVFRQATYTSDPSGDNNLRLDFAALSFTNENSVRYKTRVIGFQEEWSEKTPRHDLHLMNLRAYFFDQTFTVEVHASNGAGLWSKEPLRFPFVVSPPLWLSWWFLLGSIIFLITGFTVFYRARTRRLELRAQELKTLADRLEITNKILDEELNERRRIEGELSETRSKVTKAEESLGKATEKRKQALDELKQAKSLLIQAENLSSLGQMMASISHELANPINLIGLCSEAALDQIDTVQTKVFSLFDNSPEALAVREVLEKEIESARSPIKDTQIATRRLRAVTLAITKQSRADHDSAASVSINELVEESLLIASGKTKVFEVKEEYSELPNVHAHRSHIGQVVTNIVANAADALAEKREKERENGNSFMGKIHITTAVEDKESAGVSVVICDNGDGVPQEIQEKIFDAFFTTKPAGVGTGLGLAVCAEIIRSHGGIITLGDDPTMGGARFEIWLPIDGGLDQ